MNQTEDRARISAKQKLKLIKDLYAVDMFLNGSLLGKELTKDQKHLLVKDFEYDGTDIIATEYILREYVQNMPLSVQVRSAWETLLYGLSPYEYKIELSHRVPGLRIVGTLNRYTEPAEASLEYQDLGYTSWQEYDCDTDELIWFASQFYFG